MNKYQHYSSSVAGRVPAAANMLEGEIAVNTADAILYTKNAAGEVIRVGAGTYTKAEMDARYLQQGILPITRVGDLTTAALPITLSAKTLVVGTAVPVMLSGRQFTLAAATVSFATALPANTAGTLYIYIGLVSGAATLQFYTAAQPESYTSVFIGTLQFTAAGVTSGLSVNKVSRIDIYRPSLNPAGSAFPVSSGTPDTTGVITW